ADRYFRPEEVAWLGSLPEPQRVGGFLRLWTLKEAFIKATGEGLARDLASFWFAMGPPRIRFAGGGTEAAADWHFQQQVIGGRFIAALGVHAPGAAPDMLWEDISVGQGADHHLLRTAS
ncbi:MAG TPA: 4'-phosphopantetheinyl transferase superfamily protein, partial [Rhodopila sp.]|nr:4'-phosphopantetheinyl transferase superfamily protein [Rhodopila sp.]